MSDTVLYDYWRSSASYRVRIALNLAGIEYEIVSVDLLKKDHKSPEHLERNPQGLVPALWIDGQMLAQSLAIIEYLDETRSLGLLPKAPAERAQVRAIAYAIAMDIHPICNLGVVAHVMELTGKGDGARQDWMQKFIGEGLQAVEAMLQRTAGPLCFGAHPTLADICLMPQFYNAQRWSVTTSSLTRTNAVVQALQAIPAFAAAHPDNHKPRQQ